MTFAELTLVAIALHLFVDWFLQNDWQARNKATFMHPAGVLHSMLHYWAMLLVFPWQWAAVVGVTHYLIDLRKPLVWWRKLARQTTDPNNPATIHVAFWQDQVTHVLILGAIAWAIT